MKPTKPTKKRRTVLIDNRFQLRMAGAFIALQILLTALFATGLYLFMDSEIQTGFASAQASYHSFNEMLFPIVSILSAFSVTLSIVLVTIFVVIISHKIAGPMFRFNTVLESLSNRRFESQTQIRPDDQLGELATTLDKALNVVKADVQFCQTTMQRLREGQAQGNAAAVEAELAQLESALNGWQGSGRRRASD